MKAHADILTIEIGSTLTKIIAFSKHEAVIGRSIAQTTPENIGIGLERARKSLVSSCGISFENTNEIFALSSAAGGLRMTVHGLTRELTARAAEEAAMGAGANIKLITAGRITDRDRKQIVSINPNIIMLAGGVEYGEEKMVLENARTISRLDLNSPILFAGNAALRGEIEAIFADSGMDLLVADNVYPHFDELNVGPVRAIIQEIFSRQITVAPGMDALKRLAGNNIKPVPAACLQAAEVLSETVGDLVVVDVGGATTDVHSIVKEISEMNLEAQTLSRRTVEGDTGIYVNAASVWGALGNIGVPEPLNAIPKTTEEKKISLALSGKAVEIGLSRHAGRLLYGSPYLNGRIPMRGRDLRSVKLVIGTGGGLAGLDGGFETLKQVVNEYRGPGLLPNRGTKICIDHDYIFSACGTFAGIYPDLATSLMMKSLQ